MGLSWAEKPEGNNLIVDLIVQELTAKHTNNFS